jgi:hypothetical protein
MQALSTDRLYQVAPSVFAQEPWSEVSEKYQFIPTSSVVERLAQEGFVPVKAFQSRSRIPGKKEFTKHLLRFRQEKYLDAGRDQEVPEIVLVNSHDRSSGFKLDAGVFRVVCTNGLVVSSSNFDKISVRHSGNVLDDVIEGTYRIIEEFPRVIEQIETWKRVMLKPQEQVAFAKAALQLSESTIEVRPEQLLVPRRYQDQADDLFTVFNKAQEHLVMGGIRGVSQTGRRIRTREVASVDGNVKLNKALWTLADEMAKLVA